MIIDPKSSKPIYMIARTLLFVLLVGLLSAIGWAAETGTISGRVLSPSGEPVEGAVITLPNPDSNKPPLATTGSHADGRFTLRLGELESRLYSPPLTIQAEGLASTYVDKRHIVPFINADKDLGDIQLSRGHRYRGQVVGPQGQPIERATITCTAHRFLGRGSSDFIDGSHEVITNSEGRFVTPPLPDGVPLIRISAEGFASAAFGRIPIENAKEGDLGTLRLVPDSPLEGTVIDEDGQPVTGVSIQAIGQAVTTDKQGRFALRGITAAARTPLSIRGNGFTPLFWLITNNPDGYECVDITDFQLNPQAVTPAAVQQAMSSPMKMKRLTIPLRREGEIRGSVVDAETGEPITLSRIVLCNFVRNPDGEVVLSLCRLSHFAQPSPGKFVVGYPIPDAYHLAISAEGYEDAEAFTPAVTRLERLDGIKIKMRRKRDVPAPVVATQRIQGVVAGDADKLENSRATLWRLPRKLPAAATRVIRGRTTVGDGSAVSSQMLTGATFSLEAPVQDANWYVLVDTPDRILALHGPIDVAHGEIERVEIEPRECGRVEGVVGNSRTVDIRLWAILFSDLGIQYEVPVREDGRFEFANVFPGDYGLKVGSDALLDSDLGTFADNPFPMSDEPPAKSIQLLKQPSEPWKRAIRVQVEATRTTSVGSINFAK